MESLGLAGTKHRGCRDLKPLRLAKNVVGPVDPLPNNPNQRGGVAAPRSLCEGQGCLCRHALEIVVRQSVQWRTHRRSTRERLRPGKPKRPLSDSMASMAF